MRVTLAWPSAWERIPLGTDFQVLELELLLELQVLVPSRAVTQTRELLVRVRVADGVKEQIPDSARIIPNQAESHREM